MTTIAAAARRSVPLLIAAMLIVSSSAWATEPRSQDADRDVRARIEQRLLSDRITGIAVTVHAGRVTLDGQVPNVWTRRRAFERARQAEGVTDVAANLAIPRLATDTTLAAEVRRRIGDYAFYTVYEYVEVDLREGRVTLTGVVLADATAAAMAGIAARVDGVAAVTNLIRTLTAVPADDRIRETVATRLFEEPGLSVAADASGDPIRLLVDHGTVTLIGIVNTETARQAAERIARAVTGVASVDNKLLVADTDTDEAGDEESRWTAPHAPAGGSCLQRPGTDPI
jgi:hyperosmotically inducible periplasmic protein